MSLASRINSPPLKQRQNDEHFASHEILTIITCSFHPFPSSLHPNRNAQAGKKARNQLQAARAQPVSNTRAKQGCNSRDREALREAMSVRGVVQKPTVR